MCVRGRTKHVGAWRRIATVAPPLLAFQVLVARWVRAPLLLGLPCW